MLLLLAWLLGLNREPDGDQRHDTRETVDERRSTLITPI